MATFKEENQPLLQDEQQEATITPSPRRRISAAFDLAAFDRPVDSLYRWYKTDRIEEDSQESTMSVEELQEQFPNNKFSEPMKFSTAKHIASEQDEKAKLQALAFSGEGIWSGTIAPMATRIVGATLLDPIAIASGVAFSGVGTISKAIANTVTKFKGAERATKAALLTADLTVNSLAEGAVAIADNKQQMEYTLEQYVQNAFIGSLALHGAIAGVSKFTQWGKGKFEKSMLTAEAAMDEGKDVSKVLDNIDSVRQRELKIDDMYSSSVTGSFDETLSNRYLRNENGDDLNILESFDRMKQDLGNGKITTQQMDDFQMRLDEAGFERRKLGYADSEIDVPLKQSDAKAISDPLKDPSTDFGYREDVAEKMNKSIDIDAEVTTSQLELAESAELNLRSLEQSGDLDSNIKKELNLTESKFKDENAFIDNFEEWVSLGCSLDV